MVGWGKEPPSLPKTITTLSLIKNGRDKFRRLFRTLLAAKLFKVKERRRKSSRDLKLAIQTTFSPKVPVIRIRYKEEELEAQQLVNRLRNSTIN